MANLRGTRKRRHRRDAGQILLTDRDVDVLVWTAEQYAVPFDQIAALLGRPGPLLGLSATRRVLARLRKAGLLTCQKILADEPSYCWLTRKGLKRLGVAYTYWKPTIGFLAHIRAASALRMALEDAGERRQWVSERDLRQGTGIGVHVPDAELRDQDSDEVIAIEVERSQKGRARLREIAYKLAGTYTQSWIFARRGSPAWQSWERVLREESLGDRIQLLELPVPAGGGRP